VLKIITYDRMTRAEELPVVYNVLDGEEILAVAVRRRRRGQRTADPLVAAAGDRREELVAEFDDRFDQLAAGLE
jgi:hypothetical protein